MTDKAKAKGKPGRDAGGPGAPPALDTSPEAARARLAAHGRNDPCPCGSGKKYKKCHLQGDEVAAAPAPVAPDADELLANGWRLFEQRRPGAAEKEFRAALALTPDLADARVGIGLARLQAGDADGARAALAEVITGSEALVADLRAQKVKDAFTRKEAQPYVRAAHALGCLAYDQDRFEDALGDLTRVFEVDDGAVGTEARLIAGKTLVKLGRPADAIPVLQPAIDAETGGGRAQMGLALAHLAAGDRAAAERALGAALEANPHFARALLGQIRKRVENLAGAAPGSREEALVYAQTYGDVWDQPAKKVLAELDEGRAGRAPGAAGAAEPTGAGL